MAISRTRTIAEQLSMPIGSIGPTRGRCLEHLRQILAEMELSQVPASRVVGTAFSRRAAVHARRASASTHLPPEPSTSGKALPDLGQQVRYEQEHGVRGLRGEVGRTNDGNVRPRHAAPVLGRRRIHNGGQQPSIHAGGAEERDRTRSGAVAQHAPSRVSLRNEPVA